MYYYHYITFTRKLQKRQNVYVYSVTNHRIKGTKEVKQHSVYIGKEITVDGKTVIRELRNKINVGWIADSAPYIMY